MPVCVWLYSLTFIHTLTLIYTFNEEVYTQSNILTNLIHRRKKRRDIVYLSPGVSGNPIILILRPYKKQFISVYFKTLELPIRINMCVYVLILITMNK